MSKNVSDYLLEMIVEAGVKCIYAISGDSLNPVNDAARRDGRLPWIHVRHEETSRKWDINRYSTYYCERRCDCFSTSN
jgi:glyoxylate carboligase